MKGGVDGSVHASAVLAKPDSRGSCHGHGWARTVECVRDGYLKTAVQCQKVKSCELFTANRFTPSAQQVHCAPQDLDRPARRGAIGATRQRSPQPFRQAGMRRPSGPKSPSAVTLCARRPPDLCTSQNRHAVPRLENLLPLSHAVGD